MTYWTVGMSGAGPFTMLMNAVNDLSGTTCAVTVDVRWQRDAYGYSAYDNSADWSITIDGTRYSGTDAFDAPAGGAIGQQVVASKTKNITLVKGAAARTITVATTYGTATNSAGSGSLSRSYTLPRIPYDAPGTPKNPSASSPSAGAVVFDWDAGTGRTTVYNIRYRRQGTSTWANTTDSAPPRGPITGLTPGGVYEYQIQAENEDAASAWTAIKTVTLMAGTPGAPTGLACAPFLGPGSISTGFTPTWTAPSNTGGKSLTYDLQYRIGAGAWTAVTNVTSGQNVLVALPGQSYEVQVRAKNADATGAYSASAFVTSPGIQPQAQPAPALTPGAGTITATFTDPSDTGGKPITQRDLQYQVSNGSWVVVSNVTSPYTITGLTTGASVNVQTRTRNADSVSGWSPSATATVGGSATGGKAYNGSTFVPSIDKVWNGSAWVTPINKVWNGSAWVSPV